MRLTSNNDADLEQDVPKLRPVSNARTKAFVLSSFITVVITIGLLFTPPNYEAFVLINFNPSQVKDEWDLMKDETRIIDFEGQIRSRAVLAPALEEIKLAEPSLGFLQKLGLERYFPIIEPSAEQRMVNVVDTFQRHLTVERIRHSSLLRISVKMTSPEMAAKAANAIANSFFNFNRQQYLGRIQEELDTIEHEIDRTQEDLNNALNKRNAFLKQNGWDDYTAELTATTNRVSVLKQKFTELETFDTTDTPTDLDNNLSMASSGYSALLSQREDGNLNQLIQKMDELDARYLQVKSRYKDNSPPVLQIAREKIILKESIKEYINNRKNLLSSQLKAAQKELQGLLSASPQIQSFQGAIDNAEKRIQELMGERSSVHLQIDGVKKDSESFGELHFLDRAVVPQTTSSLQYGAQIGVTAAASFLISFCLLMIVLEVWNQALLFIALQSGKSANSFEKIL